MKRERTLDRDLLRHDPFRRSLSWNLVECAGIVGTLAAWLLGLIIWGAILGGSL